MPVDVITRCTTDPTKLRRCSTSAVKLRSCVVSQCPIPTPEARLLVTFSGIKFCSDSVTLIRDGDQGGAYAQGSSCQPEVGCSPIPCEYAYRYIYSRGVPDINGAHLLQYDFGLSLWKKSIDVGVTYEKIEYRENTCINYPNCQGNHTVLETFTSRIDIVLICEGSPPTVSLTASLFDSNGGYLRDLFGAAGGFEDTLNATFVGDGATSCQNWRDTHGVFQAIPPTGSEIANVTGNSYWDWLGPPATSLPGAPPCRQTMYQSGQASSSKGRPLAPWSFGGSATIDIV